MKRLISVVLIIVLILPFIFSGCKSKVAARELEYVQDSIWFDNTIYDAKFYENCYAASYGTGPVISISEDELVIHESFTSRDKVNEAISCYELGEDGSCTLKNSIDLIENGLYYQNDETFEFKSIIDSYMVENYIYSIVSETHLDNDGNYQKDGYIQVIDINNGCLLEEIRSQSINDFINQSSAIVFLFSEDKICTISNTSNDIFSEEYSIIEMDSEFNIVASTPLEGIDPSTYFTNFFILSNNHALAIASNRNTNDSIVYDIDLDNCEATTLENPPDELLSYWNWECVNGRLMLSDTYGIYEYDYDSNTVIEILNYNNCNVIRSEVRTFKIVYVTEDTIYACSLVNNGGLNYRIWKFTKAESNPNVGKGIIRIAELGEFVDEKIAKAVYEFNESSETAYVVFDDRYVVNNFIEADPTKIDTWEFQQTNEYKEAFQNAQSALSNQLRVDIMAGDGPDVILDAYNHSELNNSDCLIDLKSELIRGSYLNVNEYLPCIFGHADEIYQVPLHVFARGIIWQLDSNEMFSGSYGLTYEEYLTLVDEVCNGKDPISFYCNRTEYFLELFNNSFNTFIHDGTIDIDNEEFRSLAEFTSSRNVGISYDPYSYSPYENAYYCGSKFSSGEIIPTTLNRYIPSALPSFDGSSNIKYQVSASIGVAASCPMMEEALSLITTIINGFNNFIRTEDVYSAASQKVTDTIHDITCYPDLYQNPDRAMLNGNEADIYLAALTASTELIQEDPDINIILYEEIQAYFAGDKTLDEVIPIIEDRCQTVLDERG